MIEAVTIHHVSISVTNLEKANEFYKDILCLEEIDRPDFGFKGAWYAIGDRQLHLIEYPSSSSLRHSSELDSKVGHFALRVKDYSACVEWLKKKSVPFYENPTSRSGFAQIFVADPDGNLIELNTEQ
ncbi:VOC family protein [Alkalihalobacillus sp. CinArs1]|uniref:VOC family protein n=1 Tax=Alkalihalobacillus sp. CinArs1 TaxID=2995314 RepID=UPI0022DD2779|nr:VOC family protein [Alkalihalobacillus sp. CinArs1]